MFNQFIKLAGSSIYSYSTVQDKMHSVASANIAEKSYWDSFLSVARFEGAYYNVVFSVRSIDSDVRGQIYDSWIKKRLMLPTASVRRMNLPTNCRITVAK